MPFVVTFKCTKGHESQKLYGSTFTREEVKDHSIVLATKLCKACAKKDVETSLRVYSIEETC